MTLSATTNHLPKNELSLPIATSQSQGWENILVEEFRQPPGWEKCQNSTEHIIYLSFANRPFRLLQIKGDRSHTSLSIKGDISITPAGLSSVCQWEGQDHWLQIRLCSQFLQEIAQNALKIKPNDLELLPEFRVRDPQIEQIGLMLHTELKNGGVAGKLYVDSLTNLLAVHLLRNYAATKPRIVYYQGGLSDRQLLRVTEYINEHLDKDIKLADIAQLLEMSQFHFSRLFKKSLGISPHQHLIQQRLERAKQLLKQPKLTIADVAFQCGFNSQSHLGKAFREATGVTPKAYREGVGSKE